MRLFTPAQAGLDNKPDINDLLLLGQAALTHGQHVAVSSAGPLSQALPLPPSTSSFLMAPSTVAAAASTTMHQSLLAVAVTAPPPPPPLPQHPVKIEAAHSALILPSLPAAAVEPPRSEQELKALNERMCMPPPPPPPPPAQRASPPSGVSSTSEDVSSVGTKKTAKTSTSSTITNDRSDIGKLRDRLNHGIRRVL